MALSATADKTKEIAFAFDQFSEPLSDYPDDMVALEALEAELFATSSALRELELLRQDPRNYERSYAVSIDVDIVLRSLKYTFDDVHRIFGSLGARQYPTVATSFRAVWDEITVHFYWESKNSLCQRLGYYRQFLVSLGDIIRGVIPDMPRVLRARIENLLDVQNMRLPTLFDSMALGNPEPRRPPSFDRPRPIGPPTPSPPPDRGVGRGIPISSAFPPRRPSYPTAPEVPLSPTTTNTTSDTTFSTRSTSFSSVPSHWISRAFEQDCPTTHFTRTGPMSACLEPDQPDAVTKLAQSYEKLLDFLLDNGFLVRLYVRQSDQRARIYCRSQRDSRSRTQCCILLTSLRIVRSSSTLHLCRLGASSRDLIPWANLRFLSYERMIIFYCTFLALRSEDTVSPLREIRDHELKGEEEIYGGRIYDDNYEHALRLWRDDASGGIRLQASVLRGELKRTPVWTAFITHQIASSRWMRQVSSTLIYLSDLRRFIFTDQYQPQLAPGGEQELRFVSSHDARSFVNKIKDLALDQAEQSD